MFIDHVHLIVQAGNGGNGCESYFRRTDRKIIPTGGDGGHGGAVIFRANTNAPSLVSMRFKQHLTAESGGQGGSSRKRGKNGEDLIVLVPPGTRITDRDKGFVIRDLVKEGDEVVALTGGKGGTGNDGGREATQGQKGIILNLELSILLVADIFLVGLPNSGKSKILNAFTRAHVKEGNYAFTTRSPEIGVWAASDYEHLTLCELPSIYQHSHEGRGMGAEFLKHLERAKFVLYILDPLFQFSKTLAEGFEILREEIKVFREDFLKIPYAVIVNKIDLPEAAAQIQKEKLELGVPVFYVSATTGEGMKEMTDFLKEKVLNQTGMDHA